jgi:hypothetical protein
MLRDVPSRPDPAPSARRSLLALALVALAACQPEEYALLLDIHARSDVRSLKVDVIPRDGSAPAATLMQAIERDADAIAADAPIRVAVSFVAPVDVIVSVAGDGPDGLSRATRCYGVRGVVRDDALLVAVSATDDADGDGFPAQGAVSCLDPDGSSGSRACDNACASGVGVDCRGCVGSGCPDAPADADDTIYPGAGEVCADGVDQDCDGEDAECGDRDGDGYRSCGVDNAGSCDCADTDRGRNPGAMDVCGDGVDQNCDGVDAACDRDGDGVPADREVGGMPDCDDTDPAIRPDIPGQPTRERCTDEGAEARDENCNRLIDELPECASDDLDADGAFDCARTGNAPGCDCNDCDPTVSPRGIERCGNTVDEDCNGTAAPCFPNDRDGDGETASSAGGADCNDDPGMMGTRFGPDAIEVCGNGVAESCRTDVSCASDTDGDGYAEPPECEGNASIVPYSDERCNGIDDNCDGRVDEPSAVAGAAYDACILARAGETGCDGGRCAVQYANNIFHCGGCRLACDFTASDVCIGGTCQCSTRGGSVAPCGASDTCCAGAGCHDLQTDLNFCGSCGNDCAALFGTRVDRCASGGCSCGGGAVCAEGQTCCGGTCVDLRIDATNCGRCGNRCMLAQATSVCEMSSCAVDVCTPNFDDCDRLAPNGCEADLSREITCGLCSRRCAANGGCAPAGAGFNCVCDAGYAGDGVTCNDVNECTSGTPCGMNSACTNTVGAYTCACLAGYSSGDGRNCTNINECAPTNACGRNLSSVNTCTDSPGSYTCSCGAGFTGTGTGLSATCANVNECSASAQCGRTLTGGMVNSCTDTVGGYTCACGAGFTATGSGLGASCINVDECATTAQCGRALGGGSVNSCMDSSGGYTCTCGPGFQLMGSGLTATCVNVNECAPMGACGRNLSMSNTCADSSGGYTCTCGAGFMAQGSGLTATCVDVNECMAGTPCGSGGTCTNTTGGYTCSCGAGYMLMGSGATATCVNVNECATASRCGRSLGGGSVNTCTDSVGDYACTCGAGFTAQGTGLSATCVDVNECVASAAQCGRSLGGGGVNTCSNTSGGYTCSCGAGFAPSGSGSSATCIDIDECAVATTCNQPAGNTCTDTSGGYTCTCTTGYMSSGSGLSATCADVNECATASQCGRSLGGGSANTCDNAPGSYACTCGPGFMASGSGASATCVDIDECATASRCGRTLANGMGNTCTDTSGGYTCTCAAGFTLSGSGLSATCVDVNECATGTPCGAGGMCSNNSGSYACMCGDAVLDCDMTAPDCETTRGTVTNCNDCGVACSGATPVCCPQGSNFTCKAAC